MKYVFRINVADDVKQEYVNTALQTCKDFLDLFPEYKNAFDIRIAYKGNLLNKNGEVIRHNAGTISEDELNNAQISNRYQYIRRDDGKYLIPSESMEWYEKTCIHDTDTNALNYDKISPQQKLWVNNHTAEPISTRYFHLGITNKRLCGNELDNNGAPLYGYGISTPEVGTFVSTNNFSQDTFKKLIMHEFGHVFRAVHTHRDNITNSEYGEHCGTDGCVVKDAKNQQLDEANLPNLFCDDCISSMRTYIGNLVNNEHTNNGQTNVVDSSQELPLNTETDDEFKHPWRIFANKVAEQMHWEYEEDERDVNFKAKLKASDGSFTLICASSANNVSLSAKNSTGASAIPDLVVFKELVEKIRKDGNIVNFGNIKTPEFKARLLIACMEANPPIETKNAPALDNDFYAQIEDGSVAKLKILDNKLKHQNTENNKRPVASPSNNLVVSEVIKNRGGR